MMMHPKKSIAWVLLCAMLLPAAALGEADTTARIESLEARVAALEAAIAAMQSDEAGEETAQETLPLSIGTPLTLGDGSVVTIDGYDTGTKFRYSAVSGFSTLTLSSKTGYRLLCLYMTVENKGAEDLYAAKLLDAVVHYGKDYTNKAQDSFFYRNSRGTYSSGLKAITPRATVEGCLLFAVPEDVDTSRDKIVVRISYDEKDYECVLREAGMLLDDPGDEVSF